MSKYMIEKKTTAEYRFRKWKEKNGYDPKTKTIDVDGHRLKIKYNDKSKNHLSRSNSKASWEINPKTKRVDWDSPSTYINVDRAEFNHAHKDSHKFSLAHEIGHILDIDERGKSPNKSKQKHEEKNRFIHDSISYQGKNPLYHDINTGEYIADEKGIKMSNPRAMKHLIHDLKNEQRRRYKNNNRKVMINTEDKILAYQNIGRLKNIEKENIKNINQPDPEIRKIVRNNDKINKHLIKRYQDNIEKSRAYNRESTKKFISMYNDGMDMRLKSATDGKLRKREVFKKK